MENDDILVENVLNGNIESFSVIVSKYQNRLLNFLLGLTSCREDAEEILQDVFIRAYNYLYRYNSNWKFSTWIYSIAANSFKDYYNKKKKVVSCQYDYIQEDLRIDQFSLEEDYEAKELYKEVVKLINGLKDDQRIALILKQIQGFSYNEIAKILGVTGNNAKVKVFRARQTISEGLLKYKRGV